MGEDTTAYEPPPIRQLSAPGVSADKSRRIHEVRRPGPVPEFVRAVVAATSVEAPHIDMQEANTAVSKIAAAIAEAVPFDTGSDAIAGLGPEEDAVSLDRFLSITAGFTSATVRVAMVRAVADLGLSTAEVMPWRRTDYHRFYRAVLNRLP